MRNKIFALLVIIGVVILTINIMYLKLFNNSFNVKIINQNFVINLINDKNASFELNYLRKYENFYENKRSELETYNWSNSSSNECTLKTCFNLTRCEQNFKIYVYKEPVIILTDIYKKIIGAILNDFDFYLTDDPNEACIFISSLDTLDRDKLSPNYVKNLNELIRNLTYLNYGNHLIFNLYSGSWPNYSDDLDFETNRSVIAKASFSAKSYRKNYDISFPLFHKDLPFNITSYLPICPNFNVPKKKYLVTFKGKRYLHGVGSETRNSIHHLNNNRDVLFLTTCKHGTNWKELKDERCDIDNDSYDKYDYNQLLNESTFCLVPRGRRLGTYRFLEALKVGCIPVILSNGWVLPFSEVLDWSKAVVFGDERLISHIPFMLREISVKQIAKMKYYGLFFFNEYFSTVEKIVKTTFEIIKQRVKKETLKPKLVWNEFPGSFYYDQSKYSKFITDYPFFTKNSTHLFKKFQVILICDKSLKYKSRESRLNNFINMLTNINSDENSSFSIDNLIFIDCFRDAGSEHERLFSQIKFNIKIKEIDYKNFFHDLEDIKNLNVKSLNDLEALSNCLLVLNENKIRLATKESLADGLKIWNQNQRDLVGAFSYGFENNSNAKECFKMSFSRKQKHYFISLDFTFVHRYYFNYVINNKKLTQLCHQASYNSISNYISSCFSNLINLLIYKLTNKLPLKINLSDSDDPQNSLPEFHSNICLNNLFESCFNVNKTLFLDYFISFKSNLLIN